MAFVDGRFAAELSSLPSGQDELRVWPLARARAEAVVERLVALGLAADELELRVFAAQLPITRDPKRAALNRRVDFEIDHKGHRGY